MVVHRLDELTHIVDGQADAADPLMQSLAEGVQHRQLGLVERAGTGMVDLHGADASDLSMVVARR